MSIPEEERFHELLEGELVEKAAPSGEHGDSQASVAAFVKPPFQRAPGRGGPGGWWIVTEVETLLETGDLIRPDVAGWRRERCPARPTGFPIRLRPDWVCEVISPSKASTDTVKKLRVLHRASVPHHGIVDPRDDTLTVLQWTEPGYVNVLAATVGDVVRPPPFDAVELEVATLFGHDPW